MTTDTLDAAATITEPGTQDATTAATTALTSEQSSTTATAGADTPAKADDATAETPIEYEPFAVPEGMTADEEVLGEFQAAAKELKLSQKDAQKFADLGAKLQMKQADAYRKVQEGWIDSTKTDAEFGGEKLPENLGIAKKAMAAFATPELAKVLNETGLGNHPEVIRAFYRVGKAISEDNRVVTGTQAGTASDPAKRLFPNQA
jgi:hypothetical protein